MSYEDITSKYGEILDTAQDLEDSKAAPQKVRYQPFPKKQTKYPSDQILGTLTSSIESMVKLEFVVY